MFSNKFLFTLVGLMVAVFALCNLNVAGGIKSNEGFLGNLPSMQTKVWRSVGNQKGDLFSVPGNYQALLSPRMSNVDYGANIRYNMPSYENQGVPCDPLSMADMAKENYTRENYGCGSCGGGCGSVGCKKTGMPKQLKPPQGADTPPGYAAGNYNEVLNSLYDTSDYPDAQSMMPVGDMTTVNALGEVVQPIVYDRFMFANRNSRLRSQGDPIRGDLAITPCAAEWFRPSVHPQIDLQEGAMNVLGGINNDTNQALSQLIVQASAGTEQNVGGVDLAATNMASQFQTGLGAGLNDISVTAYP